VASPVSSTRSAARATYSAYKRQPIRWRLAGGSAALTLVILLGFAVIVGTLTTRAIYKDFNRQVATAADRLESRLYYEFVELNSKGQP
jgi:two-component system OmpR family sensor kinase